MNDLLEMLETKEKLDELIQEAIGDLTVNEFQYLQESGILTEGKFGKLVKFGKSIANSAGKPVVKLPEYKSKETIVKTKDLYNRMNNSTSVHSNRERRRLNSIFKKQSQLLKNKVSSNTPEYKELQKQVDIIRNKDRISNRNERWTKKFSELYKDIKK